MKIGLFVAIVVVAAFAGAALGSFLACALYLAKGSDGDGK